MIDQINIGRFIAERRKAAGLTQQMVAERLGITDKAVSKWKRALALPDSSIMIPLCKMLGIPLEELLSGEL